MAEQFVSNSEEETEALGRRLGEILDQSTVVAFTGAPGRGKDRVYKRAGQRT